MSQRSRRGFSHAGFVKAGEETYPCHFTDMTRIGAILIFDGPIDLPDKFTVHLTADGKVTRRCRARWHEGNQIGVSFDPDELP